MDDRRERFATGLLFAVGAPVAGLAVVVGCKSLIAFGPAVLAGNWPGRLVLGLIGFFVGYGLITFTQLRYRNWLVFFGAFFALCLGVSRVEGAMGEWVLQQRGGVTNCTVLDVERREETRTDSDG